MPIGLLCKRVTNHFVTRMSYADSMFFLHIKSSPNLLFRVLCLPGDQSHPFAQPTINPLACCICWAGLLGGAVFPPWNEGPNFGSYSIENQAVTLAFEKLSLNELGKKRGSSIFKLRSTPAPAI